MHYQLSGAPSTTPEHQRGELERLVRHATPTATFVTVAGSYKPVRVRLTLLTVPDRLAEPVLQSLRSLYSDEGAIQTSAAVRQRVEWRHAALLLPVDASAPALDGTLLDGWDSACLTVQYLPGRAAATLLCCAEDASRLAKLAPEGWQRRDLPVLPPGVVALARQGLARRWTGVPSLIPVPGAAPIARRPTTPATATATTTEMAATKAEPVTDPLDAQAREALTASEDGLVLGVGRDGTPIRLARRSQLLSLEGPAASFTGAVLALLTRAMQARMSVVLAVPRANLPLAVLSAWEERVRWLDIQRPQDSATLRWRAIAPDLLADALGVEPTQLPPPLPSRFLALLQQIGARELCIPELLTLTAGAGDDLRQVLRAGGLLVVPQDGDMASELLARLVLAALATPPALGCGLVLLLDPALVAPPTLAAQAIQVVLGARPDALLRLEADAAGWQLRSRSGTVLADLQADLLMDASGGRPDLIQTVLTALGASEMPLDPAGHSEEYAEETGVILDEEALPWGAILDDGGDPDDVGEEAPLFGDADLEAAGVLWEEDSVRGEDLAGVDGQEVSQRGDDPAVMGGGDLLMEGDPVAADELGGEDRVAAEANELPSARDAALDALLMMLLELPVLSEAEGQVQALVADEDWSLAELAVRSWLIEQGYAARPWAWLAVLVADDRERSEAARHALIRSPDPTLIPSLGVVLEVLEGEDAPDLALLLELAQGAGVATQEVTPGLVLAESVPSLLDPALPLVGEEAAASGLVLTADPAVSPLGLAASVEPDDQAASWAALAPVNPGTPLTDGQDQALAEQGDLAAVSPDHLDRVEPILALPAWVPLEPAAPWGYLRALEREAPEGIAPAEPVEPLFWEVPQLTPSAGSPLSQGSNPGLPDASIVEGLDDMDLIRAWQGGATSAELVMRLVVAGVDRGEARQRVRAILRAGAETPTVPPVLPIVNLALGLVEMPDPSAPSLGMSLPDLDLDQGDPTLEGGDLWRSTSEAAEPLATPSDPALEVEDRPVPELSLIQPEPVLEGGDPVASTPDLAPNNGAELLTPKGVAEILGCQDGYVRKLIKIGRLPAVKDERGYNLVARADVLAYQRQNAEHG